VSEGELGRAKSAVPPARTATHVITGAAGSGKTSLIRALLARRPAGERWAILVNDFGAAALGADVTAGVMVREVAGCICCAGQVLLRTGLVALLREARPHRVLIEASTAAEPSAIGRVLSDDPLATALDRGTTIATASLEQLSEARYVANTLYREQIKTANVIVLTGSERQSEEKRASARAVLSDITSRVNPAVVALADVDLQILDRARS
jgi:G3E family GTPase